MSAPETLDLRGVRCPLNVARALIRLEGMDAGEELLVIVNDGEALASVPDSLDAEGHELLARERAGDVWHLRVRAGGGA